MYSNLNEEGKLKKGNLIGGEGEGRRKKRERKSFYSINNLTYKISAKNLIPEK